MSVIFNYVGFFKTESAQSIYEALSNPFPCFTEITIVGKDRVEFIFGDEGAYDSWKEAYAKVKMLDVKIDEYLILEECDHSEEGIIAKGNIDNKDIEGIITFGDYPWFGSKEAIEPIEGQFRTNLLSLDSIPDFLESTWWQGEES
ncbi:hypothetical protein Maes01_02785 [Microbulbifer aestuariivivens]|uniref:Uncharacterized protein n=1 Tax=Microbulbifer aestuariivivens TaxID=1908308 RepID=A0ABP9WSK9_9GAMM